VYGISAYRSTSYHETKTLQKCASLPADANRFFILDRLFRIKFKIKFKNIVRLVQATVDYIFAYPKLQFYSALIFAAISVAEIYFKPYAYN